MRAAIQQLSSAIPSEDGRCYDRAGEGLMQAEREGRGGGLILAHGTLYSASRRRKWRHAWILHAASGLILDMGEAGGWAIGNMDQAQYEEEARYTPSQAAARRKKIGHWGPWHNSPPAGVRPHGLKGSMIWAIDALGRDGCAGWVSLIWGAAAAAIMIHGVMPPH